MSLEGGREGREGRGREGRGGEGGREGGRDRGREEGGREEGGEGGRGDDCNTYYSDGTIIIYRPTMKNYIYITMTSRIT